MKSSERSDFIHQTFLINDNKKFLSSHDKQKAKFCNITYSSLDILSTPVHKSASCVPLLWQKSEDYAQMMIAMVGSDDSRQAKEIRNNINVGGERFVQNTHAKHSCQEDLPKNSWSHRM